MRPVRVLAAWMPQLKPPAGSWLPARPDAVQNQSGNLDPVCTLHPEDVCLEAEGPSGATARPVKRQPVCAGLLEAALAKRPFRQVPDVCIPLPFRVLHMLPGTGCCRSRLALSRGQRVSGLHTAEGGNDLRLSGVLWFRLWRLLAAAGRSKFFSGLVPMREQGLKGHFSDLFLAAGKGFRWRGCGPHETDHF